MALIKKQLTASFTDDVGNAVAEAIVTARLTRPDQDNGEHISPTTQTWRADANGEVTLDLWPNTRGEADSAYHIRARDPETGRYVYDQVVIMPEADTTLDAITDLTHDVKTPNEAWQVVATVKGYTDEAGNHRTTAQRYASEDEDKTVVDEETGTDTGTYSSKHHRAKSEQAQAASESARDTSIAARNSSQDARDDSDEHATTSERWATETGGTVVDKDSGTDSGEYSAKEYAQGSQAGTGGSAKNWAQKVGAAVVSGLYSAKEWAVGTFTRGTAGGGSAKDWATLTGQTVDDTAYSAKEHAQGDLEGHGGSSKAWATDASSPDGSGEKSAKTLAGEASTSASNAATSESNAATSETNAANSASAAATSESDAQSHLDSFEDRWWGAFSSEPSTDPNGNGPDEGDLYFNITDGELKVYDAALGAWKAAALDASKFVRVNGANAMEADLDFGGHKATNLADGTAADDGVTKGQLDAVQQNRSYKDPVRVATAGANVDLTSATDPNPIDGVTLADGDRVLLKDQTAGAENGIYDAVTATDPTTWVRSADADVDSEVTAGMAVISTEGTDGAEIMWLLTTDEPTLGTDALSFTGFNLAALVAGDGIDKTNNTVSVDGTVLRDADKTGADAGVVSGTAGTGGNLAQWNADGDAVDSGVASSEVLQDSDLAANGGDLLQEGVPGRISENWEQDNNGAGVAFGNIRNVNRGQLFIHSNATDQQSEIYFGWDAGEFGADSNATWLISDRGSIEGILRIYRAPGLDGSFNSVADFGNDGTNYLDVFGEVRDDGTTLTDYVFDAELDGQIDTAFYDDAVPNREHVIQEDEPEHEEDEPVTQPVTTVEEQWDESLGAYVRRPVQSEVPVYDEYPVLDEDGNEVGTRRVQRTRKKTVPAKERKVEVEERTHEPAREFALDELDPETFAGKWQADRKLPALRRLQARSEAAGKSKSGLGETIQSLIETCEAQAVHIERLRQRIDALENGQ